jgi:hypothetical protein
MTTIAWLAAAPLFAADVDYLKLIAVVVGVSMMAINHLLAGLKKAKAQQAPPDGPRPAVPPGGTPQPDLNAEVREFLRRSAQRTGQTSGSSAPGRNPPAGSRPMAAPSGARRDQGSQRQKRKASKPVAPKLPAVEDSLANRHVTSSLETSVFDGRAQRLSTLDKQNEIDAQGQQKLDRPVGQLTSGLESASLSEPVSMAAESPLGIAADIAALLANPRSVRNAMILNEILTRPVDRW